MTWHETKLWTWTHATEVLETILDQDTWQTWGLGHL